jgi:hypothetical protein
MNRGGWCSHVIALLFLGCGGPPVSGQPDAGDPGQSFIPPDPCEGIVCNAPPESYCTDFGGAFQWSPRGVCEPSTRTCKYEWRERDCPASCLDGRCVPYCTGVVCDNPPKSGCTGSHQLITYESTGTCYSDEWIFESCRYPSIQTYCPHGCNNGACLPAPPCFGVTCDSPPASVCLDSDTAQYYTGTCTAGVCAYSPRTENCSPGYECKGGKCVDQCAGIVCSAMAPHCKGNAVMRYYSECRYGQCQDSVIENSCGDNGRCDAAACFATNETPQTAIPLVIGLTHYNTGNYCYTSSTQASGCGGVLPVRIVYHSLDVPSTGSSTFKFRVTGGQVHLTAPGFSTCGASGLPFTVTLPPGRVLLAVEGTSHCTTFSGPYSIRVEGPI